MKKNILFSLFAVICMLLTSCTNDDIAITYDTSIKIVTAGAISSFNSYHSGDFDLTGTKKVRTTLLIYNKEGDLVDRQNQYLSNYSQNMTYKASLSAGNYTILAITDIVEYSDLKIDTEQLRIYFGNLLNNNQLNLNQKEDLNSIRKKSQEIVKTTITENEKLMKSIFTGEGWFENPYYAKYIYRDGNLVHNEITDFSITTGSGRSKGKYSIEIKPK